MFFFAAARHAIARRNRGNRRHNMNGWLLMPRVFLACDSSTYLYLTNPFFPNKTGSKGICMKSFESLSKQHENMSPGAWFWFISGTRLHGWGMEWFEDVWFARTGPLLKVLVLLVDLMALSCGHWWSNWAIHQLGLYAMLEVEAVMAITFDSNPNVCHFGVWADRRSGIANEVAFRSDPAHFRNIDSFLWSAGFLYRAEQKYERLYVQFESRFECLSGRWNSLNILNEWHVSGQVKRSRKWTWNQTQPEICCKSYSSDSDKNF